MSRYLETFFQLGYHVPVYPAVLNTRGPLSALGVGLPLELGGWAAEFLLAVLYALSIARVGARRVDVRIARRDRHERAPARVPGLRDPLPPARERLALRGGVRRSGRSCSRARCRVPRDQAVRCSQASAWALVLVRPPNQVLLVMSLLPLAPPRAVAASASRGRRRASSRRSSFRRRGACSPTLRWGDAVSLKPSTGLLALAALAVPLLLPSPWRSRAAVAVGAARGRGGRRQGRARRDPRRSTCARSSATSRTSSSTGRSSSTGSWRRKTGLPRAGSHASSGANCCRASRTARTASTFTSSSPPAATASSAT